MRRRRFPNVVAPPVARLGVPDVVKDKGVKLSRVDAQAQKQRQASLFPGYGGPMETVHRDTWTVDDALDVDGEGG